MRLQALALVPSGRFGIRRFAVVAGYVLVFTIALPVQVWALGTRLDALLHLPAINGLRTPGLVLLSAGAALWLTAHVWFSAAGRGLPISSLPPMRLVKSGPYAWLRHPIYVGFTVAAAGLGCAKGSLGHGLLAPLLLATACWAYVVTLEGPALWRRFGQGYHQVGRGTAWKLPWTRGWPRLHAAVERLANRTVLFRVGPTLWVTYGAFVAFGSFLVTLFARVTLGTLCSSWQYVGVSIGLALSMSVGARLGSVAYNVAALRRRGLSELRTVGFVSWGGYLGLAAFTAFFGARTGISSLAVLDRLMPLLCVCTALGRVGCLTYGCCFGRPAPHGVRWTNPDAKVVRLLGPEVGSLPRVPVQLLGTVVGLVAAGAALVLNLRNGAAGATTFLVWLWYFLVRLSIEQLRDEPRLGLLAWTRGQWLAAIGAGVSLVSLMRLDASATVTATHGSLDLLALATATTVGAMVFAIFGLHWRQVGRW